MEITKTNQTYPLRPQQKKTDTRENGTSIQENKIPKGNNRPAEGEILISSPDLIRNSIEILEDPLELDDEMRNYLRIILEQSGAKNDFEKAQAIYNAIRINGGLRIVYNNINDSINRPNGDRTAKEVFHGGKADCNESAYLFIALAREAGLAANLMLVKRDPGERGHAISLVSINGEEVQVDLTIEDGKGFGTNQPLGRILGTREEIMAYHYCWEAYIFFSQGKQIQAEAALLTGARIDPQNQEIQLSLSILYINQRKFDDAESISAGLLLNDPSNGEAHYNLGKIYFYKNRIQDAKYEVEKAIECESKGPWNYLLLAQIFEEQWKKDGSEELWDQRNDALAKAEARFREIINNDLFNADAYRGLGVTLEAEGPKYYQAASENFLRAGEIYFDNVEYLDAIFAFEKSAELHQNFEADFKLGETYGKAYGSEKIENTLRSYENDPLGVTELMEQDLPGIAVNFNLQRADFYRISGRGEEAIAEYNKVIELDPNRTVAHVRLAEIKMMTDRREEAILHYLEAASKLQSEGDDKHSFRYYCLAARLYADINEFEESRAILSEIEPSFPEKRARIYETLASIYTNEEKYLLAVQCYFRSAQLYKEQGDNFNSSLMLESASYLRRFVKVAEELSRKHL